MRVRELGESVKLSHGLVAQTEEAMARLGRVLGRQVGSRRVKD